MRVHHKASQPELRKFLSDNKCFVTSCPIKDQDDVLDDAIIEAIQFIAQLSQEGDESLTIIRSLLDGNETESLV